jgi:hypothetical protein
MSRLDEALARLERAVARLEAACMSVADQPEAVPRRLRPVTNGVVAAGDEGLAGSGAGAERGGVE